MHAQAFLRYWMVWRQCCVPQMSVSHRLRLHGCVDDDERVRNAGLLSYPACEAYNLKEISWLLAHTSLSYLMWDHLGVRHLGGWQVSVRHFPSGLTSQQTTVAGGCDRL